MYIGIPPEMLAQVFEMFTQVERSAHEGPSAIRQATTFRPEVVLLDLGMQV